MVHLKQTQRLTDNNNYSEAIMTTNNNNTKEIAILFKQSLGDKAEIIRKENEQEDCKRKELLKLRIIKLKELFLEKERLVYSLFYILMQLLFKLSINLSCVERNFIETLFNSLKKKFTQFKLLNKENKKYLRDILITLNSKLESVQSVVSNINKLNNILLIANYNNEIKNLTTLKQNLENLINKKVTTNSLPLITLKQITQLDRPCRNWNIIIFCIIIPLFIVIILLIYENLFK
ncbi:hypothetical protein ABK040_005581 [Willaertia magna]